MAFRLNARNVFLTYPKCDASRERLQEALSDLQPKPLQWAIAREEHKDGTLHLHALVGYGAKVNIRDERHWDFDGFHPHVEAVRSTKATLAYCQKEDPEPLIVGWKSCGPGKRGRDEGEYLQLARDGDIEGAIQRFAEEYPKEYTINKPRVEENLRSLATKPSEPDWPIDAFQEAAEDWVPRSRALFLWGPSGYGKTQYAQALIGRGVYVIRHMDQLKAMPRDCPGVVFDDMSFLHWPRDAVIHLLDLEVDSGINVKHGCVVIPKGMPRIFTHNYDRDGVFPSDPAGAIDRRLFVVHVENDLRMNV